jgi:hypothetical protein
MTADAAILSQLDWAEVQCQNLRPSCTRQATHIVEHHAIDHCNNDNPFGNVVELLCTGCLEGLRAQVEAHVSKYRRKPIRGLLGCRTCGCPVTRVDDVIRSVVAL